MKRHGRIPAIVLVALLTACASQQRVDPSTPGTPAVVTQELRAQHGDETMTRLTAKDFAASRRWFSPEVRDGLSEQGLRTSWEQVQAEHGDFQSYSFLGATRNEGYVALDYKVVFSRGAKIVRLVFDDSGMIRGFFFKPEG